VGALRAGLRYRRGGRHQYFYRSGARQKLRTCGRPQKDCHGVCSALHPIPVRKVLAASRQLAHLLFEMACFRKEYFTGSVESLSIGCGKTLEIQVEDIVLQGQNSSKFASQEGSNLNTTKHAKHSRLSRDIPKKQRNPKKQTSRTLFSHRFRILVLSIAHDAVQ
jgi:hypothetical protein